MKNINFSQWSFLIKNLSLFLIKIILLITKLTVMQYFNVTF